MLNTIMTSLVSLGIICLIGIVRVIVIIIIVISMITFPSPSERVKPRLPSMQRWETLRKPSSLDEA